MLFFLQKKIKSHLSTNYLLLVCLIREGNVPYRLRKFKQCKLGFESVSFNVVLKQG